MSGAGLRDALSGADAVIDVSNVGTLKTDVSVSFFAGATRNLLAAEARTGVTHHLALTIVGADAAPEGYYAGKLTQERLVEAADSPLDHPPRDAVPRVRGPDVRSVQRWGLSTPLRAPGCSRSRCARWPNTW